MELMELINKFDGVLDLADTLLILYLINHMHKKKH